jgi:hypothetical protein
MSWSGSSRFIRGRALALLLRLLLIEPYLGSAGRLPPRRRRPLDPQARTMGLGRSGGVWWRTGHHCKCRMGLQAVWRSLWGVAPLFGSPNRRISSLEDTG